MIGNHPVTVEASPTEQDIYSLNLKYKANHGYRIYLCVCINAYVQIRC
jgi:hypothetical protein